MHVVLYLLRVCIYKFRNIIKNSHGFEREKGVWREVRDEKNYLISINKMNNYKMAKISTSFLPVKSRGPGE